MKKFTQHILIGIVLCFALTSADAQYVTIPDANFVAWLNGHGFASCMNGNQLDTTCIYVTTVSTVSCKNAGITNLTGISYFDNLKTLICYSNQLTSLPRLPPVLRTLNCNSNLLGILPTFPSTLQTLDCRFNQLTSLPVLPVSLNSLLCSSNLIAVIPTLPSTLTHLDCSANQLTTLPSLPALLTSIYCNDNRLTSLPALPVLLKQLNCTSNPLVTLPSLPSSLDTLYCVSNQLTILPSLPASLHYLYCSSNQLTSLPALPASLNDLQCSNNLLTSLPTLPSSLGTLYCDNNHLTSLPSLDSSLNSLNCGSNNLTSLPTLNSTLFILYCDYNQLNVLPLLPDTLFSLDCSHNLLTSLPLLPDTMGALYINDNLGLTCLPPIHQIASFYWDNTSINCLPNSIYVWAGANPLIVGVPICSAPAQPGVIIGNTSVCPGSTQVYYVSPVQYANGYTWTLPTGWSGTSTTNFITVTPGNTSGTISVLANGKCAASSASRTLSITINNSITVPVSITATGGIAKVCPGDTRTYTTPLVAGVNYNWTVPIGAVIISGQGTQTINVSYNNGFTVNGVISVVKMDGGCISLPKTLAVNRNVPSTPSVIVGATYGLCGKTNQVYSVTNVVGITYQWTVPTGATIVSGQGSNAITVNFPATNFAATATVKAVNACGAGAARTLTLRAVPSVPLSITGPLTACANQQNVGYSTAVVASATSYNWSVPPGALVTTGQGTNSMVMKFGTASGNVKVSAANACGFYGNRSIAVVINCREGLSEIENEEQTISIYPNPTNSQFNVVSPTTIDELKISDVLGQVVYRAKPYDKNVVLQLEKAGIYFVSVTTNNHSETRKLVVQH